jgi:hypothetical protein
VESTDHESVYRYCERAYKGSENAVEVWIWIVETVRVFESVLEALKVSV